MKKEIYVVVELYWLTWETVKETKRYKSKKTKKVLRELIRNKYKWDRMNFSWIIIWAREMWKEYHGDDIEFTNY